MHRYILRLPDGEVIVDADSAVVITGSLILYRHREQESIEVFNAADGGWYSYELLPEEVASAGPLEDDIMTAETWVLKQIVELLERIEQRLEKIS